MPAFYFATALDKDSDGVLSIEDIALGYQSLRKNDEGFLSSVFRAYVALEELETQQQQYHGHVGTGVEVDAEAEAKAEAKAEAETEAAFFTSNAVRGVFRVLGYPEENAQKVFDILCQSLAVHTHHVDSQFDEDDELEETQEEKKVVVKEKMSLKDFERVTQLDDVLMQAIYCLNRARFRTLTSRAREKYRQHQLDTLSVEVLSVKGAEEAGDNSMLIDYVFAETEQRLSELMDNLAY